MTVKQLKNNANTMEGMIDSAIQLLENPRFKLPPHLFEHSFGIVLLESVQAGFLFSAQMGTGLLLRHDKHTSSWSPPLAIGVTGVGAGLSMGAEKKHMVIFLTADQMTRAFSSDFSLRLGVQTSMVVYDVGEEMDLTAQIGNKGSGATSAYTSSRGFYMGVEAAGSALAPRTAINKKFYGQKLTPKKIVFGNVEDVPQCEALDHLHALLFELAQAPPLSPSYAETIAHPFLKTTRHTHTVSKVGDVQ